MSAPNRARPGLEERPPVGVRARSFHPVKGMTGQIDLFGAADGPPAPRARYPEGFAHRAELITPSEESALLAQVRELQFREFEFHGHTGKRRVVSFGWRYEFAARRLEKTNAIPDFLIPLRARAAAFAGLDAGALQHVLVTEYDAGAGIGWHRDKAVFGDVIGVSLLAPCVFRLRRRSGEGWERVNVIAEPRSVYLLRGPSRTEWEHSIPPVDSLRYSVTFRNVRGD